MAWRPSSAGETIVRPATEKIASGKMPGPLVKLVKLEPLGSEQLVQLGNVKQLFDEGREVDELQTAISCRSRGHFQPNQRTQTGTVHKVDIGEVDHNAAVFGDHGSDQFLQFARSLADHRAMTLHKRGVT